MRAFGVCPIEVAVDRTVDFGQLCAPVFVASLLKCGDLRGREPLLPATMFPADEDLVINNPREFGGGIPIFINVTTMSCSAGVMCGSFDAD